MLDFDDLDEEEVKDPNSLVGRLAEWETTGNFRCPKQEAAAQALAEQLAAERAAVDAKAKAKGEERKARRDALAAKGGKAKTKPRVLFLYGVGGSKALWATQAKKMITAFEGSGIEHVTLEAQQQCTSKEALENLEMFFGKKDAKLQYDECKFDERFWISYQNQEDVLDWMQDQIEELGPFDGVVGFAQGANFAAMLAGQAALGEGAPLGFACLISPNAPGYARYSGRLFDQKVDVPALLIRGEQETYDVGMGQNTYLLDKHIEQYGKRWPSDHVAELFTEPEFFTHSGNWGITAPGKEGDDQTAKMIEFIQKHAKQ